MAYCTHCGAPLGPGANFCGGCGRAGPSAHRPAAPGAAAYAPAAPAPVQASATVPGYAPPYGVPIPPQAPAPPARTVTEGMGVAALILNILVWPGLGSLVAGAQVGWAQGFLCLGGLLLTITLVGAILGVPMMIGAWIWGLVSGIRLAQGRPA